MDIGKAFTYVFDDKDWIKKVLIGGIVTIIPIVNLIAVGYGLRVLKNVSRGDDQPLPEWDDWGGDFVKGILVAVAGFIYSLPAIIVVSFASIILALFSDVSGNLGFAEICLGGIQCLAALWAIAVGLWMPAATIQYATSDEFGAFFRFGDIWALISGNLGAYGTAILTAIIAGIVGGLGTILCVVGVIFTAFYGTLVTNHALGQVAFAATPPTTLDAFATNADDQEPAF
jgi:hypothetical protein